MIFMMKLQNINFQKTLFCFILNVGVKSLDFTVRWPDLNPGSTTYYMCEWLNYLNSINSSFLILKMWILIPKSCCEDHVYKAPLQFLTCSKVLNKW